MPIIDDKGNLSAWHWMWWTLAIVVFLVVVGWGVTAVTFGLRVATAGIVGAGEARIEIQSADFRLAAYPHFFDLCAAIQGHELVLMRSTLFLTILLLMTTGHDKLPGRTLQVLKQNGDGMCPSTMLMHSRIIR